jgi:hypothetical protein
MYITDYDYRKVYQALQREGSLPLRVFLTPNYEDIHVPTVLGGLKAVDDDTGGSIVLPPHRAHSLDKVSLVKCSSMRASLQYVKNFLSLKSPVL